MNEKSAQKSFFPLLFTNFWGVLNDNFLKTLSCFLAVKWVSAEHEGLLISTTAAALVLPYILLSPLADRFTHHFRKAKVLRIAKWSEIPIILLAILGFELQSVAIVVSAITLMGVQSSLYSPSKYGLIRDIGGAGRLSAGMGYMEAIAFFGMLTGTVVASFLADDMPHYYAYITMICCAVSGLFGSYFVHAQETLESEKWPVNPWSFFKSSHHKSSEYEGLNAVLYSLSWFWWMAALMQMGLLIYCQHNIGLDSFHTGLVMAIAAIGITIGCLIAGKIGQHVKLLGYSTLIGIILSLEFILLFALPSNGIGFGIVLTVTTITAGLFKVPLDTEIQRIVKGPTLNLILAFFNQLSFIFILGASLTLTLLLLVLDIEYIFLLIGIVMFIVSLYLLISNRITLTHTIKRLLLYRYDIRVTGEEYLQADNVKLILPNHVAVIDPIMLFSYFNKCHMRPLVDEAYFKAGVFRRILHIFNAIEVPDLHKNRQGIGQVRMLESLCLQSLSDGGNVIFYPSGHITLTGDERIGSRHLAHTVCSQLPEGVHVIGIRIQGLWGSSTSRYGRKSTPPILPTLIRSAYKLFTPKRIVSIDISDITDYAKKWASEGSKLEFNAHLEKFYNDGALE